MNGYASSHGRRWIPVGALLALLAGCSAEGTVAPADRGGRAYVTLAVTGGAEAVLTVTAGDGDYFAPIQARLGPESADRWSAYVSNIPQGLGRQFTFEVRDARGTPLSTGIAKCDVAEGEQVHVAAVLSPVSAPAPAVNHAPVLDELAAAGNRAAPGDTLWFRALAHDPDPEDIVSNVWSAACGILDATSGGEVTWLAPAGPRICRLTVTVQDGRGASATASVFVDVAP